MSELKPEMTVRQAKGMCMFLAKRQECTKKGREARKKGNGNSQKLQKTESSFRTSERRREVVVRQAMGLEK